MQIVIHNMFLPNSTGKELTIWVSARTKTRIFP